MPDCKARTNRNRSFYQAWRLNEIPSGDRSRSHPSPSLGPSFLSITANEHHFPDRHLDPAPRRFRLGEYATPTPITRLDTSYQTLPETLKAAGYATGHFGKWHLGPKPYSALEQGFDVDIPHWPGPGPVGSFVAPWKFKDFDADPSVPNQHIEDRMAKEAVAFMEKHKDGPFFLNYWVFSVHAPFDAKKGTHRKVPLKSRPEGPAAQPHLCRDD